MALFGYSGTISTVQSPSLLGDIKAVIKIAALSVRFGPVIKNVFQAAAARERHRRANMLKVLSLGLF
jgi:hypothetical protein